MDSPVFLRRELNAFDHGGVRILDALRWSTPFGTGLRIYVGRDSETEVLQSADNAAVHLTEFATVAGNTVVLGTGPEGVGEVPLELRLDTIPLPTALPETGLFDDLNVFLALRHHETAEQVPIG